MRNKWLHRMLWISFAFGMLAAPACADTIPITGIAAAEGANTALFQFSGPGLSVFSATIDFPASVLFCNAGSVCDMSISLPSALNFDGPAFAIESLGSFGSVAGVTANVIGGYLNFSGGTFIPSGPFLPTITIPVTVSGIIQGYEYFNCPGQCEPSDLLWTLDISGTGQATFDNDNESPNAYSDAYYTFTGAAVFTPEPSSIMLLSIGFLAIGLVWRRRNVAASI